MQGDEKFLNCFSKRCLVLIRILICLVCFVNVISFGVHAEKVDVTDQMYYILADFSEGVYTYRIQPLLVPGGFLRYPKDWKGNLIDTTQGFEISFDYLCESQKPGGIFLNFETHLYGIFGDDIGGSYGVEFCVPSPPSIWYAKHEIEEPHVAIVKDDVEKHYVYQSYAGVFDASWHTITVKYSKNHTMDILVDGSLVLSCNNIILPKSVLFSIKANDYRSKRYVKNIYLDCDNLTQNSEITDVSLSVNSAKYNGNAITPSVIVKSGTTVLSQDLDYEVTYSNNVYVGTATVTVTGKGKYTGKITKNFSITKGAKINVTLNAMYGSPSTRTVTAYRGTAIGNLMTPKRTGYAFKGWFTKSKGGTQYTSKSIITQSKNFTLYAQWNPMPRIIFNANGGKITDGKSSKMVTYSKTYGTLPTAKKTNYTFAGWYTKRTGGIKVTKDTVVNDTRDKTLYAHWIIKYNIAFNGNGADSGFMEGIKNINYETKQNLPANSFVRTGYQFLGWSHSSQATKATYKNSASVKGLSKKSESTVKLYAVWQENSYSIKFSPNGGNGTMKTISYKYSKTNGINLPDNSFTNGSQQFAGWNTEASGNGTTYQNLASIRSIIGDGRNTNITLYAQWIDTNLTCRNFISNANHSNYIDNKIQKYLSDARVKVQLDSGYSVIFLFEGGSDNYPESQYQIGKRTARNQAVVIVIQKQSGVYKIVYWDENCSSLPDNPMNDKIVAYSGSATIYDGIYLAYRTIHSGYSALNVRDINGNSDFNGFYISTDIPNGKAAGCNGINIHTRSSYYTSGSNNAWSEGCQLVGNTSSFKKFMNVFSGNESKVGIYIVDRQLAKSGLVAVYGSMEAVEALTSGSK